MNKKMQPGWFRDNANTDPIEIALTKKRYEEISREQVNRCHTWLITMKAEFNSLARYIKARLRKAG